MEIVNSLIRLGADVKASDNIVFLCEAFSFFSTRSISRWMNDLQRGQMVVHASEILKEWFEKVSLVNTSPDQGAELPDLVEHLVSYW